MKKYVSFPRIPGFLFLIVFVPALTILPAISGYLRSAPPQSNFLGVNISVPDDHYQYFVFAAQARDEGRFFFRNPLTTESQTNGRYILLYCWLLGRVSRLGLDIPVANILLQYFFGLCFLSLSWLLMGHFEICGRARRMAFVLLSCSGGLLWLLESLKRWLPEQLFSKAMIDLNYLRGFTTISYMYQPLRFSAYVFWMLTVIAFLRFVTGKGIVRWVWLVTGEFSFLVTFFIHPYTTIAFLGMWGFWVALPGFQLKGAVFFRRLTEALFLLGPPFVVIHLYQKWASEDLVYNITSEYIYTRGLSTPILVMAAWWGIHLFIAYHGLKQRPQADGKHFDLLLSWILGPAILSTATFLSGQKYIPFPFFPLCVLAGMGLERIMEKNIQGKRLRIVFIVILAMILSIDHVKYLYQRVLKAPENYLYASKAEMDAFRFLRQSPRWVVLCGIDSGVVVAWQTGKDVYLGHPFLTIDSERKQNDVSLFFNPSFSPEMKKEFLRRQGIRYIYYGPWESMLGKLDPQLGLRVVFKEGAVTVSEAFSLDFQR